MSVTVNWPIVGWLSGILALVALWVVMRRDIRRRNDRMRQAARVAYLAQRKAQAAEVRALAPTPPGRLSQRTAAKRAQARKLQLVRKRGSLPLELVVWLGLMPLVFSGAIGAAALAGGGHPAACLILWGCTLGVLVAVVYWRFPDAGPQAIPGPPDDTQVEPFAGYTGGKPTGGRPGRK